jgi:hypothetical protein
MPVLCNKRFRKTGATLVEFAIVLPIVLLFFLGLLEAARALMIRHTADTAAYEGARCAVVPGATSFEAIQECQRLLQIAGLKNASVVVNPSVIEEDTSFITVRVTVPLKGNIWTSNYWVNQITLSSEVTMLCERPPMVQLTGIPVLQSTVGNLVSALGL